MNKHEIYGHLPLEALTPDQLYTQESHVFRNGLEQIDPDEPITFGRDANGVPYVLDGNHHAKKALDIGITLQGWCIAQSSFDVTKDPDFIPVSDLEIR